MDLNTRYRIELASLLPPVNRLRELINSANAGRCRLPNRESSRIDLMLGEVLDRITECCLELDASSAIEISLFLRMSESIRSTRAAYRLVIMSRHTASSNHSELQHALHHKRTTKASQVQNASPQTLPTIVWEDILHEAEAKGGSS